MSQMSQIRINFSQRLSQLRMAKKVKTSEISSALGMSSENYLRIEKGKQSCSADQLAQIAIYLDISADELLGLRASSIQISKRDELVLELLHGLTTEHQGAIEQIIRTAYLKKTKPEFLKAIASLINTEQSH